jgi:hypothetical protein
MGNMALLYACAAGVDKADLKVGLYVPPGASCALPAASY